MHSQGHCLLLHLPRRIMFLLPIPLILNVDTLSPFDIISFAITHSSGRKDLDDIDEVTQCSERYKYHDFCLPRFSKWITDGIEFKWDSDRDVDMDVDVGTFASVGVNDDNDVGVCVDAGSDVGTDTDTDANADADTVADTDVDANADADEDDTDPDDIAVVFRKLIH